MLVKIAEDASPYAQGTHSALKQILPNMVLRAFVNDAGKKAKYWFPTLGQARHVTIIARAGKHTWHEGGVPSNIAHASEVRPLCQP